MKKLKKRIFSAKSFSQFMLPGKAGDEIQIFGLKGSLVSFFLAYLAETKKKLLLYITSDIDAAERLRDDLELILDKDEVRFFPSYEILPYDEREPNPSLIRLRLETLQFLLENDSGIIIADIKGLLLKVPSSESFVDHQCYLEKNKSINFEKFIIDLDAAGYKRTEVVESVGQFAVRGGIIDVYPWTSDEPVRIEFFGDKIESLRLFNVITQRSINEIDEIEFLPHQDSDDVYRTLFDYLPENSIVLFEDKNLVIDRAKNTFSEIESVYKDLTDNDIFPAPPEKKYLKIETLDANINKYPIIRFDLIEEDIPSFTFQSTTPPTFAGHLNRLFSYLKKEHEKKSSVYIQCDSRAQAERMYEILEEEGLDSSSIITESAVHHGFIFKELNIQVLTDHEIFDRFKRRHTYKRFKSGEYIRSLTSLNLYDYLVHIEYGIGQYLGLTTIETAHYKKECVKLEYADGDSLLITVDRLSRIQKYSSEENVKPKLTKLGTGEWERLKKRTIESIQKIASDLIKIDAARKMQKGIPFSPDTHWQKELEASFPFEETEDQNKSIIEVKKDLESDTPMDRLLCGDVGYGKTEVALRAAFKVIMDGKQVAILVPTTILAYQHYQTFKERMADFPVNVELLSRFRSAKQQKSAIEKMKKGEIDVVIGTHRLISNDVKFRNLGLLVIDEEQRFGVKHKEKLKKLKVTVDVLTMTATPIPRTLHMSLLGARDLSHIETPPRNRLPVITEIHEWDDDLIKFTIQREIARGGQVYFVHNEVKSIEGIKQILSEIVPDARTAVAHGQLPEKQLEKIMFEFIHKKYDVLISTMIIENGLDIPNVNTIIINKAHKFGLSQLYQLRGRVGRSDEQAYAYLLVPPISRVTEIARKRLRAIQDFTELGSGLKVALRDMEIRGVGNILGKEQSGFIQSVGFDLYCRLLDDAVKDLKNDAKKGETKTELKRYIDPKVDVDFDLVIPKEYIFSETERVAVYHRLVNMKSIKELEKMKSELRDRFGYLPQEVANLIDVIELKVLATNIYASHVILNGNKFRIKIGDEAKEDKLFFSMTIPKITNLKIAKSKFFGDQNELGVEFILNGQDNSERLNIAKKVLHCLV